MGMIYLFEEGTGRELHFEVVLHTERGRSVLYRTSAKEFGEIGFAASCKEGSQGVSRPVSMGFDFEEACRVAYGLSYKRALELFDQGRDCFENRTKRTSPSEGELARLSSYA